MTVGDRVSTEHGVGTVTFVQEAGYVGVALDERVNRADPLYVATVLTRAEVRPLMVEPRTGPRLTGGPGGDF